MNYLFGLLCLYLDIASLMVGNKEKKRNIKFDQIDCRYLFCFSRSDNYFCLKRPRSNYRNNHFPGRCSVLFDGTECDFEAIRTEPLQASNGEVWWPTVCSIEDVLYCVPEAPLNRPICCHKLDVSITFVRKISGFRPHASAGLEAAALVPECLVEMRVLRLFNLSQLYAATLCLSKNSLTALFEIDLVTEVWRSCQKLPPVILC